MREYLEQYTGLYFQTVVEKKELDAATGESESYKYLIELCEAKAKELTGERIENEAAKYPVEQQHLRELARSIAEHFNALADECKEQL